VLIEEQVKELAHILRHEFLKKESVGTKPDTEAVELRVQILAKLG
jgi:hypothetical protein